MPQGGRQPPKKAGSATAQPKAAEKDNWQRSSGAFSGAAKKDYLQWKRQQKAARAASSVDDEAVGRQQHPSRQKPSCWSANEGSLTADAAQPLRYCPLYAVHAVPFCMPAASAQPHDNLSVTSTAVHVAAASGAPHAASSTERAAPVASTDSSGPAAAVVYMPRLDPVEVGFTPAGFQLDMPTRPQWQGVVSTADELHALEEAEFAAWQSTLAAKVQQLAAHTPITAAGQLSTPIAPGAAGGSSSSVPAPAAAREGDAGCLAALPPQQPQLQQGLATGLGSVSSYEGRLEYWRQLWRTLEMSDMVCMIVDARNPLLHFSYGLYRHITQDHKLPLVLLLNKCDLLPAAAATAWQQYLQQQLPGVTVIPVSASTEQAGATARQVLCAVLQQQVEKDACRVTVQELVGLSVDELIHESVRRNTHAKRHLEAQQQQPRQQDVQQLPPQGSSATSASAAAAAASTSSDDDQQWSLKPSRGKRAARRKGRQQQQQQMRVSASHNSLPDASEVEASASDAEATAGGDVDNGTSQQQQQQPMDQALAALTLEGRLPSRSAGSSDPAHPSPTPEAVACQAGACCPQAATVAASQAQAGGGRPVVVGMLGEPNVGKSSTLNALLGSHRVAVSSHPGRTKHYQTHYMCDSLVLVDCPGIVFPRLNVSPAMQVLYGSSPIASCRQPYAVVRYLAEASWPRVHTLLKLQQPDTMQQEEQKQQAQEPGAGISKSSNSSSSTASAAAGSAAVLDGGTDSSGWSPYSLCEALAAKRHFILPRSGRLDTYRAANWLLRAALAGQHDLGLAFLPPA